MQLPGKNTLKKAFMTVAATASLALGGCAVVPVADPYGLPPPLPANNVYIEPIAPLPYVTVFGPTYNYHAAPHFRRDDHRHEAPRYVPPRRDYRPHR